MTQLQVNHAAFNVCCVIQISTTVEHFPLIEYKTLKAVSRMSLCQLNITMAGTGGCRFLSVRIEDDARFFDYHNRANLIMPSDNHMPLPSS
jgi:hypothetical protein